jgi:hypothetical protein
MYSSLLPESMPTQSKPLGKQQYVLDANRMQQAVSKQRSEFIYAAKLLHPPAYSDGCDIRQACPTKKKTNSHSKRPKHY